MFGWLCGGKVFLHEVWKNQMCGKLESPPLSEITFHVPSRNNRTQTLFAAQKHCTSIMVVVPSRKAQKLYNKLTEIDSSLGIFLNPRKKFFCKKILQALAESNED